MRFLVGAVLLLASGSPAGAASEDQEKDQLIRDLQKQVDELARKVAQIQGETTAEPQPAAGLEEKLDEAILQSPAEPVREPTRLNFTAPGLDNFSASGRYRPRFQYLDRFPTRGPPGTRGAKSYSTADQDFLLGLTLKVSEKTQLYMEMHDQRVFGGDPPQSTNFPGNAVDNNFELSAVNMLVSDVYNSGFDFTVGRQKVELGAERMIGDDEWQNFRTRFDGLSLTNDFDDYTHLFVGAYRLADLNNTTPGATVPPGNPNAPGGDPGLGNTNSAVNTNSELYVAYFTYDYAEGDYGNGTMDLYFMFLDSESGVAFTNPQQQLFGMNSRNAIYYYGVRVGHDVEPIWIQGEFVTQFGEFMGNRENDYGFDRWAMSLHTGLRPGGIDYFRGVYVGYDYASGGSGSFVPLFPSIHGWFGILDVTTWSNIQHWVIGTEFEVLADVDDSFDLSYHWLRQAGDYGALGPTTGGFGGTGASFVAGSGTPGEQEIGQELDAVYSVQCTDHSNVDLAMGYFWPGDSYTQHFGTSADIFYTYVQYVLRF